MKKLLMLLCLLVIMTACNKDAKIFHCNLFIYSEHGIIFEETGIAFTAGDTVLDILKNATREARIHMEYTGAGITAYVKGIDNLYEFDKGPDSGWVYYVNDERVGESAGSYTPADGDYIFWRYLITP